MLELYAANFESYSPKEIEISVSSQPTGDNFGRKKRLHIPRSNTWVTLLTRSQLRQLGLSRNTIIARIRVGILANHSGGVNSKVCALRISRLPMDSSAGSFSSLSDSLAGHTAVLPTQFLSFTATVACLHSTVMSLLTATASNEALLRAVSDHKSPAANHEEEASAPASSKPAAHRSASTSDGSATSVRVTTSIVHALLKELEAQACFRVPVPAPVPFSLKASTASQPLAVDTAAPRFPPAFSVFRSSDDAGQVASTGGPATGAYPASKTPTSSNSLSELQSAPLWLLRVLHDVANCSKHAKSVLASPSNLRRLMHSVSMLREDSTGSSVTVWFQSQLVLTSLLRLVLPLAAPNAPIAIMSQGAPKSMAILSLLCSMVGVGCYILSSVAMHGVSIDDLARLEGDCDANGTPHPVSRVVAEESKADDHVERESKDDERTGSMLLFSSTVRALVLVLSVLCCDACCCLFLFAL